MPGLAEVRLSSESERGYDWGNRYVPPAVECDGGAVRRISGDETGIKDNKIRRKIYRIRSRVS
jgi:hypothetical protein